ncbi:MAG: alginate lyase family protein [Clostridia bacterium]|nr:alginate lyase family protein [Clostridia bacterium]
MNRREQLLQLVSDIASGEDIALKFAVHLEELFDIINADAICDAYRSALERENYAEAAAALAKHFREKDDFPLSDNGNVTENPGIKGTYDREMAENTLAGRMREVNINWEFPDGEIDFLFDPTALKGPRNHEWLWQFNRHAYWRNLACTYSETGDEKYARGFVRQLIKWIAQTDLPEQWNGAGSAWRTIECGLRLLGSWPVSFNIFRKSLSFPDAALLLMIASMHRQSVHLVSHPTGGNWLMMESNGIYTFSALFTELVDAEQNRALAAERLICELEKQILPDGMHNELSPDYQGVVFTCAANFYYLAQKLELADEVPEQVVSLIRRTVKAAICLSTPAFTQPRTNDTFTIRTGHYTERAESLLGTTPEYRFMNSRGSEGVQPLGDNPSVFLPWAGFAVMRTGWGADDAYLCFDVGPLGAGHMHQDKLNINLYKGEEELIFDDGGGQYEHSPARGYATSGYGHNTLLVDGEAQSRRTPLQMSEPIDAGWVSNETFDYAFGVYEDGFGKEQKRLANHKREVRFCKPGFFCVVDTVCTADGNAHDYELIFHLDTTKVRELDEYKNGVISEFGRRYELAMIPFDGEGAEVTLQAVSAQTEPRMRGWYNGRNESCLHEAITVSRKVSGVKDYRFVTLLFPVKAESELPKAELCGGELRICFEDREYVINSLALDR